jgi:hypothetical protein
MKKTNMIADLGCPNTGISANDAEVFAKSLTEFQQDNLEYIEVKKNFKFGPSGPYKMYSKAMISYHEGTKTSVGRGCIGSG